LQNKKKVVFDFRTCLVSGFSLPICRGMEKMECFHKIWKKLEILELVLNKIILHTYRLYSMELNDKVTKCVIEKILILSLLNDWI
jgi:hypothetical protein